MENSSVQEASVLIDNSSEAYAERLELCVLRSVSFASAETELPERAFFAEAFRILEARRAGSGESPDRGEIQNTKLCKLETFWLQELEGLPSLKEGGCTEDLTAAWETTLQLLFEAESAFAEGRPADEKEMKDILYSYSYDYAEEFLLRDEANRKAGRKVPLRFVTELALAAAPLSPHAEDGIRLFFGDRLKGRLLEALEKCRQKEERPENMTEHGIPEVQGLSAHQKKSLAEFFARAALLALLTVCMLSFSACGKGDEEETSAAQTEAAESYPGIFCYESEDGTVSDRFGVMHATVLEVQNGEKDGYYVYMLRDEEDPENVWCLYSQDVGSIVAEMNSGKKVAVLFSGDIVGAPDSVEFIAILDDAPYTIKKTEGTITANMMNSFVVRADRGGEMTFIKDNCKVDRDALSTDGSTRVLICYADCGGDKYPVRVYKLSDTKDK